MWHSGVKGKTAWLGIRITCFLQWASTIKITKPVGLEQSEYHFVVDFF
jgi:hypothetical protein